MKRSKKKNLSNKKRKSYRKVSRRKVSRRSYKKQRKKRTNIKRQSGGSLISNLLGLCTGDGEDSPECRYAGGVSPEGMDAIKLGEDAVRKVAARREREGADLKLYKDLKRECESLGLVSTGTKNLLIPRLEDYYRTQLEDVGESTEGILYQLRDRFEKYTEFETEKQGESRGDGPGSEEDTRAASARGGPPDKHPTPVPVIAGCEELKRNYLQLSRDCFYQASLSILYKSYGLLIGLDERLDAVLNFVREISDVQDYRCSRGQECVDLTRLSRQSREIFEGINSLYELSLIADKTSGRLIIKDISSDGELIHHTLSSGELQIYKITNLMPFMRSNLGDVISDYNPEELEEKKGTGEEKGLTVYAGETVVVTENSDPNWWEGYVDGTPGKKGLFPASSVNMRPGPAKDKLVLSEGGYENFYVLACLNYAFTPYLKTAHATTMRAEVDTKVLYIPLIFPNAVRKINHLIQRISPPPLIIFGSVFMKTLYSISRLAKYISLIKTDGPPNYLLVSGVISIYYSQIVAGVGGQGGHAISYILCGDQGSKYILCDSNYADCIDLTETEIEGRYANDSEMVTIASISFVFRRIKL